MQALNCDDPLVQRYSACQEHIASLAKQAGRRAKDVALLVVSKSQSAASIRTLHHAGQLDFGENYLQESLEKITALHDLPLRWHFIGRIQRNKTSHIAQHFDWVHSIESTLIALRLNDARAKLGKPPLNVCVQINIDDDPAKSGTTRAGAETLLRLILTLPHLRLRGLMILPRADQGTNTLASFERAKQLFDEFSQRIAPLDTLSMGMSDDMEQAIQAGSTMIRVGRRIFSSSMD